MTSPQMTRLDEHLQRLRLNTVRERLEALLQEASEKELSYADFLDGLLSEEVETKTAKHVTMRTNLARFPFIKGLDSFDFGYQPSVDRKQVQKLSLCHFVEHGENLVLGAARRSGPPANRLVDRGLPTTHLAVGFGLKAIERGYRVLFTTAAAMLTTLTKALSEGRFDDKLKVFTIPRLLIIDEIGYLPIDRQAATLFFQLISRRYERGPMILTSNQSFGSWGDVFGDRVIASAILDRILHHATTISIRGDSYRLKDKLKSGVVSTERQTEVGWSSRQQRECERWGACGRCRRRGRADAPTTTWTGRRRPAHSDHRHSSQADNSMSVVDASPSTTAGRPGSHRFSMGEFSMTVGGGILNDR